MGKIIKRLLIFGFLCYKFLDNDFELTTIDCEPNSAICVDEVNKYFNNIILNSLSSVSTS